MKATLASGRYPLICRTYISSSSARSDSGPNSSWATGTGETLRHPNCAHCAPPARRTASANARRSSRCKACSAGGPAPQVGLSACSADSSAAMQRAPARFSLCQADQSAAGAHHRWQPAAAAEPAPAGVRKRVSRWRRHSSVPPSRARRALLRRRAAPRLSAPSELRRRCHRRPQLARSWLAAAGVCVSRCSIRLREAARQGE